MDRHDIAIHYRRIAAVKDIAVNVFPWKTETHQREGPTSTGA